MGLVDSKLDQGRDHFLRYVLRPPACPSPWHDASDSLLLLLEYMMVVLSSRDE